MSQIADRIYRNAKIYSVALDGTETHAEALAIKDGKFVYVGDEAGVKDFIGDNTEIIDCNGKSIIPGLGDAHMHIAHAAKKFFRRYCTESQDRYSRRRNQANSRKIESLRRRAQRRRGN